MTDAHGSGAVVAIELKVYSDLESASDALASRLVEAASAETDRRRFCLALSGGTTPSTLYRELATRFRGEIDWGRVHLFWSDERYVSPGDEASNVGAAMKLLEPLDLPTERIHAPDTSVGDPGKTARRYEEVLAELGPLDFALLGLGEDGHIASLFPASTELDERTRLVVAVENSPKPPPRRITMTLAALAASREVHVLAAGASKRAAVSRALDGAPDEPLSRLSGMGTKLTLWVDRAASPVRG